MSHLAELPQTDQNVTADPAVLQRQDRHWVEERLRRSVPVLEYADWQILEFSPGRARTLLPLNTGNTNHHGTLQGALMALAGEFTGGLALTAIVPEVAIAGVHPTPTSDSGLAWLLNIDMKFLAPCTDDLVLTAEVPLEVQEKTRRRFLSGRRVILPIHIDFRAGEELVASADMTFFLQHSSAVAPKGPEGRSGTMHRHLLKSSARMVAALRAEDDPYSAQVAGRHGALLAENFSATLPELGPMVVARTRHLDGAVRRAIESGVRQIVTVCAGLDCRPFRMADAGLDATFYELDLPAMLEEREAVLARVEGLPHVERRTAPINLEHEEPADVLARATDFDPSEPTFVIFEGGSMYFDSAMNERIFRSMAGLLGHPESLLWADLIDSAVLHGAEDRRPEVVAFVDGMADMGECFKFGTPDPASFVDGVGLEATEVCTSAIYQGSQASPLFGLYRFITARRRVPASVTRRDPRARPGFGRIRHGVAACLAGALLLAPGTTPASPRDALEAASAGRGGATLALGDGAAVIHNPAALGASAGGRRLDVGLDSYGLTTTNRRGTGRETERHPLALLPQLAFSTDGPSERWRLGAGNFVVGGVDVDYGAGPGGEPAQQLRAVLNKTVLSAAYQASDRLWLGVSAGVARGELDFETPYIVQEGALRNLNADLDVHSSAWAPVWAAGLRYRLNSGARPWFLGASYTSATQLDLRGHSRAVIPGIESRFRTEIDLEFPQQAGLGIAGPIGRSARLAADIVWTDWSGAFSTLDLRLTRGRNPAVAGLDIRDRFPLRWRDTVSVRAGIEWNVGSGSRLRVGYAYHPSPVPADRLTPLLPVLERHVLSTGWGYRMGSWTLDFAVQYAFGPAVSTDASDLHGPGFERQRLDARTVSTFLTLRYAWD